MAGFQARHLIALLLLAVYSVAVRAVDYISPGLTPEQVLQRMDTTRAPLVVDVRSPAEFAIAHIPGAINAPLSELEARLDELKHDNGVLIYCINGSRTRKAEAVLMDAGLPQIYHLQGTFSAWIQGKYPIAKGGVNKTSW